jgi:uncharacterized protein YbbC (DUF1343 family)
MSNTIFFGIDQLLASHPSWKLQKIGLVTNEAAKTYNGIASRKALQDAGFKLVKLFSPEHGLSVKGADGAAMHDGVDELTDLPIISLYGNKLAPTKEDLAELEIILFDVPDAGVRFYTYLWTLTYLMETCATSKKKIIVLDRPNPISGILALAEGPFLEPSCSSFIGRWPIPIRHSCSLGELARFFNETQHIKTSLEIIACTNWNRNNFQPDWTIPFVGTSPAIQSFESMLLYPGLCFLEATNLHEGRGTEKAFQIVGAPWLKNDAVCAQINNILEDEINATPIAYMSKENKYIGKKCNGIHFKVKDQAIFRPIFFGLMLIKLIKELHPVDFAWATYPTNVNPNGTNHLDKLLGIPNSESLFDLPFASFLQWATKLTSSKDWEKMMEPYLLY